MKDYSNYTAADFARDPDFLRWVKYPKDYPHLDLFWKNWLNENPYKQEEVEEASQLIQAILEEKFHPSDQKQRAVWSKIQSTIQADLNMGEPRRKEVTFWQSWISKAAVVLVLSGIGWIVLDMKDQPVTVRETKLSVKEDLQMQFNHTASAKTIVLTDGTSVVLQPQSGLQYPRAFKTDFREVYLTGEAFFEVKKDANRPFLVHANEIVTRVLGTSFTVRNFKEQDVLVRVKTGKVSVFKEKEAGGEIKNDDPKVEGVLLTPNQQVVYERNEMKMTKSLVENPSVLVPVAKLDFEFSDAPIKEVFDTIEKAYGVDIVYDEEVLANCYLNASLSDVPLYDKLNLICKGINTTYEMIDSHIIIYGKGCGTP